MPTKPQRRCAFCGYSLRGLQQSTGAQCPECGAGIGTAPGLSIAFYCGAAAVAVDALLFLIAFLRGPHDEFGMPSGPVAQWVALLALVLIVPLVVSTYMSVRAFYYWWLRASLGLIAGVALSGALLVVGMMLRLAMN